MRRVVQVFCFIFLFLFLSTFSAYAAQSRISESIDSRRMTALRGNVRPMARAEFDQGALAPTQMLQRVTVFFQRTAAQQHALDQLLQEQQDPKSANYRKWLTPEQFADRFGMASADVAKVQDWLTAQGFKINVVARGRGWITFSGSAGEVSSAFQTELHQYAINGRVHFANGTEPAIPAALAGVVRGVRGLDNFKPKPRMVISRRLKPDFTSNISGNHFIAPDDFARIYGLNGLYANGIDGTGQKIAVMGQTDITMSDITTFRSVSGLPANTPQVVLVPGSTDPGVVKDDLMEADLDVEWAGAVAKNAQVVYVNSNNGVFDSLQYAVDQNIAPVISISYGDCEANFAPSDFAFIDSVAQQANAQGQTIVGPSGDSGATDCDYSTTSTPVTVATHGLAVDVPASSPNVTAVGGTTFSEGTGTYWSTTNNSSNGSALFYIPEAGWNDTTFEVANGGSLSASGGGVSTHYTKPSWQTGTGVPADGHRDVPDIAFNASFDHDGFIVCSSGDCVNGYRASDTTLDIVGGTSAGVPTFAGVVALINQKTNLRQGNLNQRLYALASSSPYVFHDVTSGDNKVPCQTGTTDCPSGGSIGYSAATGYDLVTGLGSVDAYNLVSNWTAAAAPDFGVSFFDGAAVTLARGNSATVPLVLQRRNGFAGTVSLSCAVAGVTGTTCSVSPTTVNPDGSISLTITASNSAALRVPMSPTGRLPWWESGFGVAALLGMGSLRASRKRLLLLAMVVLAMVVTMVACGGGGSSSSSNSSGGTTTTAQSGTVTVTASSGSLAHTAQVAITVN